jgi:hypothetical protein
MRSVGGEGRHSVDGGRLGKRIFRVFRDGSTVIFTVNTMERGTVGYIRMQWNEGKLDLELHTLLYRLF